MFAGLEVADELPHDRTAADDQNAHGDNLAPAENGRTRAWLGKLYGGAILCGVSLLSRTKRVLIGPPLATKELAAQRLIKLIALAIFSSDAISSTAYATEEVLFVLIPSFGLDRALRLLIPISVGVVVLLALVVFSYTQTIRAYPHGGGSYVVSRENLGVNASLVAGASLLVDYTLTVAVSVSSGTAAITSAVPDLFEYRTVIAVGVIVLLTLVNLRGIREAGNIFAAPTYMYVFSLGALIIWGLGSYFIGGGEPLPQNEGALAALHAERAASSGLGVLLLMRAFGSGAVALTGVEAISNSVDSFKRPAPRNATITLIWMAVILGSLFFLLAILVNVLRPTPYPPTNPNYQTLLSLLGREIFGTGFMYYLLQASTALILFFAANTAFQGFPRLSAVIAEDDYMPRQLSDRGDRLVFSNGVIVLAALAVGLVIYFRATTSALIPLYAVGVFTAFTLSQFGMVQHHRREREPHWKRGAIINTIGGIATGVVLAEIIISKFFRGAWVVVIVIPIFVLMFKSIHRHYARIRELLRLRGHVHFGPRPDHTVVVLVRRADKSAAMAIEYARDLDPTHMVVVSIVSDPYDQNRLAREWDTYGFDEPIEFVHSRYRAMAAPVFDFLDELEDRWGDQLVTLIWSDYLPVRWWEFLLHRQTSGLLKARLKLRPNTVVTSLPYNVGLDLFDADGGDDGGDRESTRAAEPEPG